MIFTFEWPQIFILSFITFVLIRRIHEHGKIVHFEINAFSEMIIYLIILVILYCGGFFS